MISGPIKLSKKKIQYKGLIFSFALNSLQCNLIKKFYFCGGQSGVVH